MTYMIRVNPRTAQLLKEQSLVHDANGKPAETYDSIIRRAIASLKTQQHPKKIDVSQI